MIPITDNTPKRFMIRSTIQNILIFCSICEKNHYDRDSVIDNLMLSYIQDNIDDDELLPYVENIWNGTTEQIE